MGNFVTEFNDTLNAHLMNAYMFFNADGQNTINYGNKIIAALIAIVSALGGGFLVVVAIKGIVMALKGDNKDWGKAGIELGIGIIGGVLLAVATATTWTAFFKNTGSDFNVVGS